MTLKHRELLPRSAGSADKTIQKLAATDTDRYIHDSIVTGLVLRITPAGRKIWHLRYQVRSGQSGYRGRKYTFGNFSEGMSTREAREVAEDWRVRIRQGEDPLEERALRDQEREIADVEAKRSRKTLNDVAQAYQVKLANPVSGHKDGGENAMLALRKHLLSRYGDMPIKEFRREHLFDAVDSLLARGHNTMANAVLTGTKSMFRDAVKRGSLDYSPIDMLGKRDVGGPDQIRERVLCQTQFKPDELHEFFIRLPDAGLALSNQIALHLLLGTACRVGELFKAQWAHVDFQARRWVIPAENSKNGDPLSVHLSQFTLDGFLKLYELSGHTPWLFPGRSSRREHLLPNTLSKQVGERQKGPTAKRQKGRTKHHSTLILPGGRWTVHDLRRTAATQMQMLGISPHIIDECQNHRSGSTVRRRYQHGAHYDSMIRAWDMLGGHLSSLCQASPHAKLMATIEHIPEPTDAERHAIEQSFSKRFDRHQA